jgi:protein-S-isoprenylcysteine O-methyltransferase Ste14
MGNGAKVGLALTLVAVVFAIALTYAAVELPRMASAALIEWFDPPDFDPTYDEDGYQAFLEAGHLRLIGPAALLLVIVMIVGGLATERRGVAAAGGVAFFLPLFGHFARSMFFLAGLGLTRTVWLPILHLSPGVLRLGDVVYLPYAAVVWLTALAGLDIRGWLSWALMGCGMVIFVHGTLTWFRVRFSGGDLVEDGLYRFSRHPQYLGWLVWSYGLTLYLVRNYEGQHFKLGWEMPNSLPWLVSALVIVGVAWVEEIAMEKRFGERYADYRARTPFLLPVPRFLGRVLTAPVRLVTGRDRPESGRQVLAAVGVLATVLILLSVPFLAFDWPPRAGWWAFPYNVFPFR